MNLTRLNLRDQYGSVSYLPSQPNLPVTGHYDNGGTSTNPAAWLLHLGSGAYTASGKSIDEWIGETIPEVGACVRAYSETVAQLPMKLYRKTGKDREVAEDHPLYLILHDLPNPEMTAYQFREVLTRHLATWCRAYAYIQRDRDGEVVALWPIHPTRVKVDRDALNRKRWTVTMADGVPVEFVFNPDRPPILHMHMNSNEGLDGRSLIWMHREALGITKAAEEFVAAWFGNGAIPGIIATHPGRLSDKAKETIRQSWWKRFGGARNANKLAILEEDIKVTVVGADAQKAQLRELREDQISTAARIWRVPNVMIGNHTKDTAWGSGVEQQFIAWVNGGLGSYLAQWCQAVWRDCLSRKTYKTHYAKFVTAPIERGSFKDQMDAFAVARQHTIFNADEIRAKLDENPIKGGTGETYLIPSGAQVLVDDGTPIVQESAPAPSASEPKGVM